ILDLYRPIRLNQNEVARKPYEPAILSLKASFDPIAISLVQFQSQFELRQQFARAAQIAEAVTFKLGQHLTLTGGVAFTVGDAPLGMIKLLKKNFPVHAPSNTPGAVRSMRNEHRRKVSGEWHTHSGEL